MHWEGVFKVKLLDSEKAALTQQHQFWTCTTAKLYQKDLIPYNYPFCPPLHHLMKTRPLTQPPYAIASHLIPLTKTEIISPLKLFSSTSYCRRWCKQCSPPHFSLHSSTPPSTQQNARAGETLARSLRLDVWAMSANEQKRKLCPLDERGK